jgi:hypothetical protein
MAISALCSTPSYLKSKLPAPTMVAFAISGKVDLRYPAKGYGEFLSIPVGE